MKGNVENVYSLSAKSISKERFVFVCLFNHHQSELNDNCQSIKSLSEISEFHLLGVLPLWKFKQLRVTSQSLFRFFFPFNYTQLPMTNNLLHALQDYYFDVLIISRTWFIKYSYDTHAYLNVIHARWKGKENSCDRDSNGRTMNLFCELCVSTFVGLITFYSNWNVAVHYILTSINYDWKWQIVKTWTNMIVWTRKLWFEINIIWVIPL